MWTVFERNSKHALIQRCERITDENILCSIFSLRRRGDARLQRAQRIQRAISTPRYELRLYHVNDGKIEALKSRFGNYTDAIFKRHKMKSIGYWSPEDAPSSQNLFIYILEHPSRQDAEKNWAAFQADPEWQKVKAESEANGPLVDHIDRYFMDPTSFSALQ
jgi:NIPSNAP